ncbi:hypothetical protein AAG570_009190 [Ranatra chinensis]|uniref:UDP-glucuronosyltransferase n=1 Tax=Ranatra chinensis TaxID=642074 RepID=A0ABD0YT06_9HEMI
MFGACLGADILVMLPLPLYSHTNTYMPIIKELAARGHNVTMVTPFKSKDIVPNLKIIPVKNDLPDDIKGPAIMDISKMGVWMQLMGFWYYSLKVISNVLEEEPIQALIHDRGSHFDLVITETFFMQEALVAFGHKIFELSSGLYYYLPQQESIMRRYFNYTGSENLPPLLEQLKNTSITLVDSHFSMGYPRPYHSNIIEIGGLSVKNLEDGEKDLQNFMDSADQGVIYFSLGSYLKSQDLDSITIGTLLTVFGKLKQRVLWKLDSENVLELPSNVKIAQWFPQTSVLAHPKCLLFITHGGIHSIFEAAYNKIPVISLPVLADQSYNAKFAEESGFGITLNINQVTEDRYKENAVRLSMITRDRPITVLKNTIYWIEYVINHKGAKHLKPRTLQISFCRYLLLDVFVPILVIALIAIYIFIKFCNCCLKSCRSSRTNANKKMKTQ